MTILITIYLLSLIICFVNLILQEFEDASRITIKTILFSFLVSAVPLGNTIYSIMFISVNLGINKYMLKIARKFDDFLDTPLWIRK